MNKKEQKIIFLDIDWVLNKYSIKDINEDFNVENVRNLSILIKQTWALIVITSDWKYDMINLIEKWPIILPMYIDSTRKSQIDWYWFKDIDKINLEKIRELEIKEWIDYYEKHNNYKIKYIVIDDMPLEIDNFIKTNPYKWLTIEQTRKAIELLNKQ